MAANTVLEYLVPMRDGIKLYTIVQLPEKSGSFPVIISRSPYQSEQIDFEQLRQENTHGYAVVSQQCRGTARSEGECNAYLNERNDGLDLLEWVRQQTFYNGEIYLFGGSYTASVHLSYLNTNPPDVKAALLAVQDSNRYNICFRHGFFKSGLHGSWVMKMHKKNQPVERNFTAATFRTMPLAGITQTIFNEYVPYIEESFSHPDPDDPYWSTPEGGSDYQDACNKCDIPILLITSMYDIYTEGIFDMWKKLSPVRKKNCALVVTPFDHAYNPAVLPAEMQDFQDAVLDKCVPDLKYVWFDHFRLGTVLPFVQKGKTVYYRLWDNSWHSTPELTNAPQRNQFFLTSGRTLAASSAPGKITYTSNPYDPAFFAGGLCNNFGGMQLQDPPNSRYDIISFLSEPLENDLICEGHMELELHCSSTAEDTCFYARISFERNGKTLPLRDDIDSLCRLEKNYTPGTERIVNFIFAPHAFKLLAGDRLRVDISSSCAPHFHVHTNQRGLQALQTSAKICRNTIITGSSCLSIYTKIQE